jgi:4-amino-4-deoxy-L-arabinose transferase-like glycosyltransferase
MTTTERIAWLTSRMDRWRLLLIIYAIAYAIALSINLSSMSMEWDEVTHFTGGLLLSRGQVVQWVWTNSFYPPVYDLFAAFYFLIGGASVFTGRLVAVTFSALTLFAIYEIANSLYNAKIALVAAVLFSVAPGIVWLSRMAMIETMLVFIFTLSMLFFFSWLRTDKERDRTLSLIALVVGVAVKYQMLVVVPLIMLLGMFFWKRDYLKTEAKRWLHLPRSAILATVIVAAAIAAAALLASGLVSTQIYAIQVGTAERAIYSARYPLPVFYFFETALIDGGMHPISLLPYFIGLGGLGLLIYRRKREDRFLLLWFAVIYVVFTVIPNRDWRYVTPLYPVLAIAAASLLVVSFEKLRKIWQTSKVNARRWGTKIAALALIAFTCSAIYYSSADAITWVKSDQIQLPIEEATNFAAQNLTQNQMLLVACAVNRFSKYMVSFYLNAKAPSPNQNQTIQYPLQAVDSFAPDFNTTELVALCQKHNVKDVLLYECGENFQYFGSTLTSQKVTVMLNESGFFTLQATFGEEPNRIFVFAFQNSPT